MPPILGRLLEDPYAAVRYIAGRSLRHHGILATNAYDFVGEPDHQASVAKRVVDTSAPMTGAEEKLRRLLRKSDGTVDREGLGAWESRRDPRPVHLRE